MNIFSKLMFLNPFDGDLGWGVKKVVASGYTTWFLMNNGDLYGCGSNSYGQQGDGTTNNVTTFTKRASNVADFDSSSVTTWYITTSGDLYGCGWGGYGQQGSGSTSSVNTFTKRASSVVQVVCSSQTTWYIDTNGDLYGCGSNSYGQQGDGTTNNVTTFTKRASNVKDVVCSDDTIWYVTTSGDLYGCGYNNYGNQGSGSTSNVTTFTQRASNVKNIACSGSTTWYLTTSGDLYGCGYGEYGQQGSSGYGNVTTFTKRASNVKNIACSYWTTWYIDKSGDLYGCGHNYYGQQGSGTTSNVTIFTKRASNVVNFDCSSNTTWYIDNNGDLYGCGQGSYGQQGSGSTSDALTFTKRASNIKNVYGCNQIETWYIDKSGDLYGCGHNYYGQQGSGTTSNVSTFTKHTPEQPPSTIFNYGFRIDTQNSDPTTAITYIEDNADFTPASMNFSTGECNYGSWGNAFFQPRPVMVKYDGTVDYELDKNDFTKKKDGVTASDVSNTSYGGNCMIAFPQVWLKFKESNNADGSTSDSGGRYQFVYVSNWNRDGNYHCYTHQNKNGAMLDEIFIQAFEPSNVSSKLRSLAGQTILDNLSGVTMQSYAQANGSSWDFMDYGEVQMLQMLCVLMFKSLDSQGKIGAGVVGNTNQKTTGTLKDKPMFYATDNTSSSDVSFKAFGIENLWGDRSKWINGLVVPKTSSTASVKYKLCDYTTDGSTSTSYTADGTGYKTLETFSSANGGYPNKLTLNADGLFPSLSNKSGSDSTYIPDYFHYGKNSSSDYVAFFGGDYSSGLAAGVFCLRMSRLSYATVLYGASLSCKPL